MVFIRARQICQPIDEHVFVLLQQQELTENHIRLVEALVDQLCTVHRPDAGQLGDGFLAHRFGYEILMLH